MEAIFTYVTVSNKEEATSLAKQVVEARLAACANIIDKVESVYWWADESGGNKVQQDSECVLILKTKSSLFPELEKKIKELHSYSCPCIIALPIVAASKEYLAWLEGEVK